MKTADILNKLSDKQIAHLKTISDGIKKLDEQGHKNVAECYKYTARGYIKGLVDGGVINQEDFRGVWSWFTLLLDR